MSDERHLFPTEEPPMYPAERPTRAVEPEGNGSLTVAADAPATMLQAILTLAKDPAFDTAKFEALLKMQATAEAKQAEIEFNQSLARLAGKMPRVKKNGRVDLGPGKGSYPFARWEDVDRIIRPLMELEGFTLSFTSQARQADGGGLIVTGTLLHRLGHSMAASMPLPLDTGPGRNNLQAAGSTLSYGKRYCAEMLLNIVREGADDDGMAGGNDPITDEECAELSRGLTETKSNLDAFLSFMAVPAIPDIQKKDLTRARNAINHKRHQKAKP